MDLVDLLAVAVLVFIGSRLLVSFRQATRGTARRHAAELYRSLRLRHFAPVPVVLALVVGAASLLVQLPVLEWGWWTAIGGYGNPAFGVTDTTAGTSFELLIPLLFVVLLVPALPLLVEREEVMFRLGAEMWSTPRRIGKAFAFGLVHAIIGIPLGVALALSIGGAWFTVAYLRGWRRGGRLEALRESTRAHLAYNTTIVGLVALALVADLAYRLLS